MKKIYAIAAAAGIGLVGIVIAVAVGGKTDDALLQRVTFLLEENAPERALQAIGSSEAPEARLKIARYHLARGQAALAYQAVESVQTLDKPAELARRIVDAKLDALMRRVTELQLPRAPFRLQKYQREPENVDIDELRRVVRAGRAAVTESDDIARFHRLPPRSLHDFAWTLALSAYALGDAPQPPGVTTDAQAHAVATIYFEEGRYDDAFELWKPLVARGRLDVFRTLSRFAHEQRAGHTWIPLWDYRINPFIEECRKNPDLARIDDDVRAEVQKLYGQLARTDVASIKHRFADLQKKALTLERVDDPVLSAYEETVEVMHRERPKVWQLLTYQDDFTLSGPSEATTTAADAELTLSTRYGGPIEFQLYRFASLEDFGKANATTLTELLPKLTAVKRWTHAAGAMTRDGTLTKHVVKVPHREPGLYLAVADARYSPVKAFATFAISDVALVVRAARNKLLVWTVHRTSGLPLPNQTVGVQISGSRRIELKAEDDDYKAGFMAGASGQPLPELAAPEFRKGHAAGQQFRRDHPDDNRVLEARTDDTGLATWDLSWEADYQYSIQATAAELARAKIDYAPEFSRTLSGAVWTARPLYRPGERVDFKILLRELDAEGLLPYSKPEAAVEFSVNGHVVFAGMVPVDKHSAAAGSFQLSEYCRIGDASVRVNNLYMGHPFVVKTCRLPTFEVEAIPLTPRVQSGDQAGVEVRVRSREGRPMADQPVAVWASATRLQAKTDANGTFTFWFETEAEVDEDYEVQVTVGDPTIELVRATCTVQARCGAADLKVTPERPVVYSGETCRVFVETTAPAEVRFREFVRDADGTSVDATLRCEGSLTYEYRVPDRNRDLRVAVRRGNDWTWRKVGFEWRERPSGDNRLAMALDRATYHLGEEATVTLRTDIPGRAVLLCFETSSMHRVIPVRAGEGPTQVKIRIEESDAPNVFVRALLFARDELVERTAEIVVSSEHKRIKVRVMTDKPEYRPGEECEAAVRVTTPDDRPISGAELSLSVVDEAIYALQNDPTPKLHDRFHTFRRPHRVAGGVSERIQGVNFYVWKRPTWAWVDSEVTRSVSAGSGGKYDGRFGGGGGKDAGGAELRQRFEPTALWEPRLITDANGEARVRFRLPDAITRYRFTARASTPDHRFGEATRTAVVWKDFFATLLAPRLLQEGDKVAVTVLVHNYTGADRNVDLRLDSALPELKRSGSPRVPDRSIGRFDILLDVNRFAPEHRIRAAVISGDATDTVEVTIPGRRFGQPWFKTRAGSVGSGQTADVAFFVPDDLIRESLRVTVQLDPGIRQVILRALRPLVNYPYGCIEQTMTRLLPGVVAREAFGGAGFEDLDGKIHAGLERLRALQNQDGGWGWWQTESDPMMTSYVVYGLATCRKNKIAFERSMLNKGAAFLAKWLGAQAGEVKFRLMPSMNGTYFTAMALAAAGDAGVDPETTKIIRRVLRNLAVTAPAGPAESACLIRALRLAGIEAGPKLAAGDFGSLDTASLAIVLHAMLETGDRRAFEVLEMVLARRRGETWASTYDTSLVVMALCALRDQGSEYARGSVAVQVGDVVRDVSLPERNDIAFDGRVDIEPTLSGDKLIVTLRHAGSGRLLYSVRVEGLRRTSGNDSKVRREIYRFEGGMLRPANEGDLKTGETVIVVLRCIDARSWSFAMLTDPRTSGLEPIDAHPVDGLKSATTWSTAQTMRVSFGAEWPARWEAFRTKVQGDAARESRWAADLLREAIDSGRFVLEVQNAQTRELPLTRPSHFEVRDDRTLFFFDALPPGEMAVAYLARCAFPGELRAMAPWLEAMYDPSLTLVGAETNLRIVDGATVTPRAVAAAPPGEAALLKPLIDHLESAGVRFDAHRVAQAIEEERDLREILLEAVRTSRASGLKAWLSFEDLAVRRAAVFALESAAEWSEDWNEAIRAALRQAVKTVEPTPEALRYVQGERTLRSALVRLLAKRRQTLRVDDLSVVLPKFACDPETALRLQLEESPNTLESFANMLRRDAGVTVELQPSARGKGELNARGGTVRAWLDSLPPDLGLYYRVEKDRIVVGSVDELFR